MNNRITPENIIELKENEIFVFGSNKKGIHGKGAARQALKWGAMYHVGVGRCGNTFAIPTKSDPYTQLSLTDIGCYVYFFIQYAKDHPNLKFLVTQIGCGYAGYKPEQIAPLFKDAIDIDNIYMPENFWEVLNQE